MRMWPSRVYLAHGFGLRVIRDTVNEYLQITLMNNIKLDTPRNREILGWTLLAISFSVGIITIFWGHFGDEADNLVVGTLIVRGYALYRDVFSHHFPFPYYWMAMIVGFFNESIFLARLSVLLFQTVTFALGMRLSGNYLLVGLAAFIWSIMRPFYRGNMVLYHTFTAASLLVVFIAVLVLLQQRNSSPHWGHWLTIGLYSIIAILSDPLSAYAVGVALIFLFSKKPVWGIYPGLVIFSGLMIIFFGYHQMQETGFFTLKFGMLEMFLFYGFWVFWITTAILEAFLSQRLLSRMFDTFGGIFFAAFSLGWHAVVFPFDFTYFVDVIPGSLRFLVGWISNDIARMVIVILCILHLIAAVDSPHAYKVVEIKYFRRKT